MIIRVSLLKIIISNKPILQNIIKEFINLIQIVLVLVVVQNLSKLNNGKIIGKTNIELKDLFLMER